MEYLESLATLIGIYVILGTSYNLVFGYAGMLSVAHAVFYGIGAYSGALLLLRLGADFFTATVVAMLISGLIAALLALSSIRLIGDYLLVASFGFQLIGYNVFLNWKSVTRGAMGLPGIPRPRLLGHTLASSHEILLFVLVVAGVCCVIVWRLGSSAFGRTLRAIREDEIAAMACGKDVRAYKILTFAIAGALAAVAGTLYATYITFIDPETFVLNTSFLILVIVLIGGAGSFWGGVVGAVFVWVFPELLRFLDLPPSIAAPMRQVFYGVLLIAFMLFRPQGLLGSSRA